MGDKEDTEDLKENVTNLELNIDSIENNIGDTNITKLGDDVMSNGQRIDSIESNIGDTDISKLSDDVNSNGLRIDLIEGNIGGTNITKLSDGVISNGFRIDSIEGNIGDTDISKLSDDLDSNGLRIDSIESNIGDTDISMLSDDICDIQTNLTTLENKPRFAAEKRSGRFLSFGEITDFTELVDMGDIFNPTTGRLSINEDSLEGKYVFYVSARKENHYENKMLIRVYKKQELVLEIYESDEGNDYMINSVFTLHLKKGDVVQLYNQYDGSIYVNSVIPFTFTGYKI